MEIKLPSCCVICGKLNPRLVCQNCQTNLPWRAQACQQCGTTLHHFSNRHCGKCLKHPPLWDRLIAPWHFSEPLPQMIHRFKFGFTPQLAQSLGTLAAPYFQAYDELDPVDLIVPVPLHRLRVASRGYNQAEWIARTLAESLNHPLNTRSLRRRRHTRAQAKLDSPAARKANIQAAFAVKKPPHAQHIALVDDVVTTGATAEACIRAWQSVSPARFSVWCLARADSKRYP